MRKLYAYGLLPPAGGGAYGFGKLVRAAAKGGPMRVLLVDDQALVRDCVRTILEQGGSHEVVGEAADGAQALDLAGRLRPDVVVMDLAMPVMDGIEATRRIRRRFPQIRVLAFTSAIDLGTLKAALDAGCTGLVSKDDTAELPSAVEEVAAGRFVASAGVGIDPGGS